MGDRMMSGLLYTGIEKVLVYGIAFVQGVVLARLLSPEDFGLTAMLGIFLGFGATLAESGLGTALVVLVGRKGTASGIAAVERKVLVWNVGAALALYGLLAACAPWVAQWYGRPVLAPLMWAMAAGLVVNAASVVATARLTREERFGRLAWANGLSSIVGAAAAIVLAWLGCGVWSIVGMGLVSGGVRTGLVWGLARRSGDPAESPDGGRRDATFRQMLGYGWKLMASGLVHTVYAESYNLIIGKTVSPAAVGLFARGNRWARLPGEIVNDAVGRVALPKLAKGDSGRNFVLLNAALLWSGLVVLFAFASEIVGTVLGPKWLDCVPYLRILLVGQFFTPIGNVALQKIRASGHAELVLKTDMWKKPVGLAALVCGVPFGVAGLCWAKVVSDIAEAAADLWYALRCRAEEPVDLVYCWYSGKIPEGADKCRFADNGELYYSILSVDRFAPWFRRIYVFMNDDSMMPDWLPKHPKVRIVRHSEVIPKEVLPLNNPVSIEFWLHKLPDLCERFVYANDDMFIGRPVTPRDFFDGRGRMICRYNGYGDVMDVPHNSYDSQLAYARKFLNDSYRRYPHHNMDGYLKSVIEDFWKTYPEEALRSGRFRHRVPDQLQRDVFSGHAVRTGRGVRRVCGRRVRLRKLLGMVPYESLYLPLTDASLGWLQKDRPKFFCLNDTEACTDADRTKVREILKEFYAS